MTIRHRNGVLHRHGIDPMGTPPGNSVTPRIPALLCLALLTVLLPAKAPALALALAAGVDAMGAPDRAVGVLIAAIVPMPEGVSALTPDTGCTTVLQGARQLAILGSFPPLRFQP